MMKLINQVNQIKNLTDSKIFNNSVTLVILLQAAVLAMETFSSLKNYNYLFEIVNTFVIIVFIVEAVLKIIGFYPHPQKYFKNGWNLIDFTVIVLSLIPFSGGLTTVGRLIRLLRITRLTNRSREMSVMVVTIIKSLPSMINIFLLLSLLFFIFGIAGYHLFHDIDNQHWGTLPKAIITLFKILTLEGWVDIMTPATNVNPFYGIFFVSFIVVGTFIVINIFVAMIIRKSEDAYKQIQQEFSQSITQHEILDEMREIRKKIEDLEKLLVKYK